MSEEKNKPVKRKERWWFGGLAACIATCGVHPLDTIKVNLQTHQGSNIGTLEAAKNIVKRGGYMALYNGLSASLLRQAVYNLARFGIYNNLRRVLTAQGRSQTVFERSGMALVAGSTGAFICTPFDLVNVRMQNDIKLPREQRRNYTWVGDGLVRTFREEGIQQIFRGGLLVAMRGAFMTIGQLAFYDTVKLQLLATGYFIDNVYTHLCSSITAAAMATLLTQPFDVVKTRIMNAKPGRYSGYMDVVGHTALLGPTAFYKGTVPAFYRIAPLTIGIFVILEQLTVRFGYEDNT